MMIRFGGGMVHMKLWNHSISSAL